MAAPSCSVNSTVIAKTGRLSGFICTLPKLAQVKIDSHGFNVEQHDGLMPE
jgi:hypothetical protein